MLAVVAGVLALVQPANGPEVLGARTVVVPSNSLGRAEAHALWDATLRPAPPANGSTGAPASCVAGTVSQAFATDQLVRVNAFRRFAGVGEVVWSSGDHEQAQRASLWAAANNRLAHDRDPGSACYQATLVGSTPANSLSLLHRSSRAMAGYMHDPHPANVAVPHRRWLLIDSAATIGVGGQPGDWHALSVTTDGGADFPSPVVWPPAGDTPVGLWTSRWSLSIDGDVASAAVSVTRGGQAIPATVHRAQGDGRPGSAVVFDLPSSAAPATSGETVFDVRIDGVVAGGHATSYRWTTTFFGADAVGAHQTSDRSPATTTAGRSLVDAVYRDLAFRAPTESERARAQQLTHVELVEELANGDAWISSTVAQLYRTTLDREPDADGLRFWADRVRAGERMSSVVAHFYGSEEYRGGFAGDAAWLDAVYRAVLGRPVDAGGRDGALARLAAGMSHPSLVAEIYESPEGRQRRVAGLYARLLDRAPDAGGAEFWTGRLLEIRDLDLAVELVASDEYRTRNS